jgi:hypothetical protein
LTAEAHRATVGAQLDYAMKHFTFIADQRMRTFNFYLIVAATTTGATIQMRDRLSSGQSIILGIAHLVIAIVFAMIEHRNLRLLLLCRSALTVVERSTGWPTYVQLSRVDGKHRSKRINYRTAITTLFAVQSMAAGLLLYNGLVVLPQRERGLPANQKAAQAAKNDTAPTTKKASGEEDIPNRGTPPRMSQ